MQRLEVSGAVRLVYRSLGVKGLSHCKLQSEPRHRGQLATAVNTAKRTALSGSSPANGRNVVNTLLTPEKETL